jgi:hypothetical protein
MDFEVYCDESRPDVFSSHQNDARHLVLGSLWLPSEARMQMKQAIHDLRDKHKIGGEFKWRKVTPSRRDFYMELISWFMSMEDQLRFRCIAVDRSRLNLKLYHNDDQELGFYKFYYQMLHHWILDFNRYAIFCDLKQNHESDRLHVLQQCLGSSNLSSSIETVQAIRSRESVLLQLTDVLTGIASARLNNILTPNTVKNELVSELEKHLGQPIRHTLRSEHKFNVFVINLMGGW